MSTTHSFYQCLICGTHFATLWKVEKHVKQHDDEGERTVADCLPNEPRRRGMLPIKRVTFTECYIPVVKNQIDPTFLAQYETVLAKDETPDCDCIDTNDYSIFDYFLTSSELIDSSTNDEGALQFQCDKNEITVVNEFKKRPQRQSRIKAAEKIRKVASILKTPEDAESKSDGELEESEVLKLSDEEINGNRVEVKKRRIRRKKPFKKRIDDEDFIPHDHPEPNPDDVVRKAAKGKLKKQKRYLPVKCRICQEILTSNAMLSKHERKYHKDKAVNCPVPSCGQYFVRYSPLRQHLNEHGIAERNESLLESSSPTKMEEPRLTPGKSGDLYFCKFCLHVCDSKELLKSHLKKHNSIPDELKCPCCDIRIPSHTIGAISEYLLHIMTYHEPYLDPLGDGVSSKEKLREFKRKTIMQGRYKCKECDKNFSCASSLEKHNKSCKGKMLEEELDPEKLKKFPFACPICKKRFARKENMRRHFNLHLENNPFVCNYPDCGRKFNGAYNLRRHKLLHEGGGPTDRFQCPLCPSTYADKYKVVRHLREVHKPGDLPSANKIPNIARLRVRTKRVHINDFRSSYAVIKQEEGENALQAVSISSGLPVGNIVSTKQEGSLDEVHFTDKIVLQSNGTAVHLKGEHLEPEPPKLTSTPPAPSKPQAISTEIITPESELALRNLLSSDPNFQRVNLSDPASANALVGGGRYRYHTGKSFKCNECDLVFTRAWTLQLHLTAFHQKRILDEVTKSSDRTSSEVPITLMCGTCAYPAKDANDLNSHIKKMHKPHRQKFRCDKCGRRFDKLTRLNLHIQDIHEAERKFVCSICKKAFTTESWRIAHMKRAHREKKKCPICKRTYSASSFQAHLKRHNERIKGKTEIRCRLCNDDFTTERSLQRHIDCVHLGKPLNKCPKPSKNLVEQRCEDWFAPLLARMEPFTSRNNDNIKERPATFEQDNSQDDKTDNDNPFAPEKDAFPAILGF